MNRRSALKDAVVLAGGIVFLPSCSFDSDQVIAAYKNLNIKESQEKLLIEIVDTIIPKTDRPGAKDLKVHEFVLIMVNDCLEKSDQEMFIKSLDQIELITKNHFKKSFIKIDHLNREVILRKIQEETVSDLKNYNSKDLKTFLTIAKELTIKGYMSSKYILTEVFPYKLVPGDFKACITIDQIKIS